jgi:hypothetical protein
MIVSKMVLNKVVNMIVKNFNLEKMKKYVFEDNELDIKVKEMEVRLKVLESNSHPPRKFKCNYPNSEKTTERKDNELY